VAAVRGHSEGLGLRGLKLDGLGDLKAYE